MRNKRYKKKKKKRFCGIIQYHFFCLVIRLSMWSIPYGYLNPTGCTENASWVHSSILPLGPPEQRFLKSRVKRVGKDMQRDVF